MKVLMFFLGILLINKCIIFFYIINKTDHCMHISIKSGNFSTKNKSSKFLAIVQTNNQKNDEIVNQFIENKRAYSHLLGYGFIVDDPLDKFREPAWNKILSSLKAFDNGYEWVWLLDVDTIITNFDIKLDSLLNLASLKNYDILITKDCNGINAGSFLVRNSNFTKSFLKTLWDSYGKEISTSDEWREQGAFAYFHDKTEEARNKILFLPQNSINSYPAENVYCVTHEKSWRKDHFVIHFAGMHSALIYKRYLRINQNITVKNNEKITEKWLKHINSWTETNFNITLLN